MSRPKRKAIPDAIKLLVFTRQRGRCALTGKRLASIQHAEFDHSPPLANRPVAASGADYEPGQLDPAYIQAVAPDAHREKTSEDVGKIARSKRIHAKRAEHQAALEKRGKLALPPRPLYAKAS